jgi:hypothetical protein
MLRRVALVRTDISEELSVCFIRVTRIGELGTTVAVTNNRRGVPQLLVTANVIPGLLNVLTLMMEATCYSETSVLQESHGVTCQKTTFFILITSQYQFCLLCSIE